MGGIMLNDIIRVTDRVQRILEQHPETRDNDKLLWLAFNVKHNGLREHFKSTIDYLDFKKWLLRDETPMFESLSRCRRKLQEIKPELAGEKKHRITEAESVKQWAVSGI